MLFLRQSFRGIVSHLYWLFTGKDYPPASTESTSITWSEMTDNNDVMAQPAVPYVWPNSGSGIYPGHATLYGDMDAKDVAPAPFVTEFVDVEPETDATTAATAAPGATTAATTAADAGASTTAATDATPVPNPPTPDAPSTAFIVSGSFATLIASMIAIGAF